MAVCLLITMVIHILAIRMIILYAQQFGQIHNSIAGDVHVRGYYPGFAARYFEEHGIQLEVLQEDKEILKKGTVDFSPSAIIPVAVSA